RTGLYDYIKNRENISVESLFSAFIQYLFDVIILYVKLLGSLLILTLFSAVLLTIHAAFVQSSVSKIAYFVFYIVLIFIALNSFNLYVSYTKETVDTLGYFMIALLPLILGIMTTIGGAVSVSFFHPFILFLIHTSGMIVSVFVLPLLYLSALLKIV